MLLHDWQRVALPRRPGDSRARQECNWGRVGPRGSVRHPGARRSWAATVGQEIEAPPSKKESHFRADNFDYSKQRPLHGPKARQSTFREVCPRAVGSAGVARHLAWYGSKKLIENRVSVVILNLRLRVLFCFYFHADGQPLSV